MIGLVIFVLILPVQVFAAGEDSSSENSRTEDNMTETDLEKTQEETEQKIWELTEVKDLDTAIRKLFPEEKLHFQDLVEGSTGGREKFLQGVCIPILDYLIQFQFKIVGVMNISFFLIFYHLIRLLVKALQCELVIFQKELFCGDSLVVDALMEKYQIIGKLCLTKQGDCIEQFCVLFPVL